ncbi:hypothetical protein AWC17_26540 [Mycobacterium nebraskense]|uniref:Uncharacterized protein n=1 Tax=Mycobacterium nebraskense TaxID=244292 RepID=A0A1X1ZYY9_9MYCO|nr:hypothetical protein ABW17_19075 [Mycobacterium nebraskense]ORW30298.1 hypothetical protein AWC17_26540 [Mycobacterium nebraskense]
MIGGIELLTAIRYTTASVPHALRRRHDSDTQAIRLRRSDEPSGRHFRLEGCGVRDRLVGGVSHWPRGAAISGGRTVARI